MAGRKGHGGHLEICRFTCFLMSRKSARTTKPPGFYKAMAEGKVVADEEEKGGVTDGSGEDSSQEGSDEELKELKRMEQGLSEEVEHKKELVKRRRETEKIKLREKIASLRQQAEALESQLKTGDSPRLRHASRSLPDSSEYQRILFEVVEAQGNENKKRKEKRLRKGKEKEKNRVRDYEKQLAKICFAGDGKGRMPTVNELKKLVALAESAESSKSSTKSEKKTGSPLDGHSENSSVTSQSTSSECSSDEDSPSHKVKKKSKKNKKGKKVISGKLEVVDEMDIIRPVKYAHSKLNSDFVRVKKFDALPFHHLVAGELEIIQSKKCSSQEKEARIGVLKYLAYHFAYLDTTELKEQYDALLKQVERGELEWGQNLPKRIHRSLKFRRETLNAERKVNDRDTRAGETSKDKITKKENKKEKKDTSDEVIYCADFNRKKCSFETSHLGKWAGKDVMKLHICRKCLAEDGVKKAHAEVEDTCPHKKA